MDLKSFIKECQRVMDDIYVEKLVDFANDILDCGKKGNHFFIAGNGGSAATASHLVIDIMKTSSIKNPPVCINLSDNVPTITAIANDIEYDEIFSFQIDTMGREGDLLLIISGSGNSNNLIKAVEVSNNKGIKTWGLLGFDGGKVKDMLNDYILVPSYDYGIVEGLHSVLLHILVKILNYYDR